MKTATLPVRPIDFSKARPDPIGDLMTAEERLAIADQIQYGQNGAGFIGAQFPQASTEIGFQVHEYYKRLSIAKSVVAKVLLRKEYQAFLRDTLVYTYRIGKNIKAIIENPDRMAVEIWSPESGRESQCPRLFISRYQTLVVGVLRHHHESGQDGFYWVQGDGAKTSGDEPFVDSSQLLTVLGILGDEKQADTFLKSKILEYYIREAGLIT